jgi:uncharacterized protein (DUF849 family)
LDPSALNSSDVLIKAALNGGSGKPAPITPEEAAEEGRRAVEAGASMIHVHGRTASGGESSEPAWYGRFMELFGAICPGVMVSFTTKWAPNLLTDIQAWNPPPPVCSVNVGSRVDPWAELLESLAGRNIEVEAGVADERMADELTSCGRSFGQVIVLADGEDRATAASRYLAIRRQLASRGWQGRVIGHAYADATWGVVGTALACGDHVRVGFEDTFTLPNFQPARSNADLVGSAVQMARAMGRSPIAPAELVLTPRR